MTSALLPSCSSFAAALCWNRGAARSHRKNCGFLVRINKSMIGEENIIPLSTKAEQQAFFKEGFYGYGEFVANNIEALARSQRNREVLIMWRGKVNIWAMDVMNTLTGEVQMPLMEALAKTYCQFGSKIVRTILSPYFPGGTTAIRAYLHSRQPSIRRELAFMFPMTLEERYSQLLQRPPRNSQCPTNPRSVLQNPIAVPWIRAIAKPHPPAFPPPPGRPTQGSPADPLPRRPPPGTPLIPTLQAQLAAEPEAEAEPTQLRWTQQEDFRLLPGYTTWVPDKSACTPAPQERKETVSYTHLTLPTKRIV